MLKYIIPGSVALAAGLLCGFWLRGVIDGDIPAIAVAGTDSSETTERLRQQLRDADDRLARAQIEISRLRNRLADAEPIADATLQWDETEDRAVEATADETTPRWAAGAARFAERRTRMMADRLGWDEAITTEFQSIMQREMEWRRAQRAGEAVEPFDMFAAAAEVLDGAAYDQWVDHIEQEILIGAETYANVELARLQLQLGLNDAQRDAMFPLLYEEGIDRTQQNRMISMLEVSSTAEERTEQIAIILTEEQLAAYQQMGTRRGPGRGFGGP